ncbi:MAG: hypothetical protein WD847_12825 [Pirellulales bacterium]
MHGLLRRIGDLVKGGCQPRDVALAVALGLLAGFATGWNLTGVALLAAAALLNVHGRTFALAWAAGMSASWLLTPVTWRVGQWLLDGSPLGGLVSILGDGPVPAMLGWDRYTLVGGIALGLLLSLPASRKTARLIRALGGATQRHSGSPTDELSLGQRLAAQMWLGGEVDCLPPPTGAKPRLLRPYGWAMCLVLLLFAGWLPFVIVPRVAARAILAELTQLNGAQVTAGRVELSVFNGRLAVDELAMADPDRLDHDRLQVGRLTGQLDSGQLLRGRLHVQHIRLEQIRCDVARRQAAQRIRVRPAIDDQEASGTLVPAQPHDLPLDAYLAGWSDIQVQLGWLGRLVQAAETLANVEQPLRPARGVAARRTASRPARSELGRPQPRLLIERLRAEDLAAFELGGKSMLKLSQLSSRPAGAAGITRVQIVAPELRTEVFADLRLHEPEARHAAGFRAYDLPLAELVDRDQAGRVVVVRGGTVNLDGDGWMTSAGLELAVRVEARQLDTPVLSQLPLVHLDPVVWDEGLHRLGELRAEARLAGPWSTPRLSADSSKLLDQFKHQLRAAGEHQLVQAVDAASRARATGGGPSIAGQPRGSQARPNPNGFYVISDDAHDGPAASATGAPGRRPPLPDEVGGRYPATGERREHPLRAGETVGLARNAPAGSPPIRYPETDASRYASHTSGGTSDASANAVAPEKRPAAEPPQNPAAPSSPYSNWARRPQLNSATAAAGQRRPDEAGGTRQGPAAAGSGFRHPGLPATDAHSTKADATPAAAQRRASWFDEDSLEDIKAASAERQPNRFVRWSRDMRAKASRFFSRERTDESFEGQFAPEPGEQFARRPAPAAPQRYQRDVDQFRSQPPAEEEDEELPYTAREPWYKRMWR